MKVQEKLAVGLQELPNRIVFEPMEGCDGTLDGSIGELTRRRYMRLAKSGAGLIWFEATAVCESGRANPRQLFLKEDNVEDYAALLNDMRAASMEAFGYAPLLILQMTHSGRYSKPHGTPEPIVAYRRAAYEVGKEDFPYHVMTDAECEELPSLYKKTAQLAMQAGFDGVDVKCCHGYLLNEFLSGYERSGAFGGCFTGRTNLYISCVDAVREVLPKDKMLTTRLNAYDGFPYPDGFGVNAEGEIDLKETKRLISILASRGMELFNISMGNPYLIPHVNRPSKGGVEDGAIGVQRMKKLTKTLQEAFPNLKFVLSGLSYMGVDAIPYGESCLNDGTCSLLGFGRMTFAYPEFYKDYLKTGALDPKKICLTCGNCTKMMRAGTVAGCPVRDQKTYLPIFKEHVGGAK